MARCSLEVAQEVDPVWDGYILDLNTILIEAISSFIWLKVIDIFTAIIEKINFFVLAHDLAGSDQGGFNDPYVRLSLIPEIDSRKRQTTIHRNDPNPLFDQHFKFPISHEELQSKTLVLQVFDYDRFSRNDVIGEVRMSMDEFDVTSNIEVWGEITKNKKPPEELQEILLSLSYLPSAERLTVVLLKARNLFLPSDKENIGTIKKSTFQILLDTFNLL